MELILDVSAGSHASGMSDGTDTMLTHIDRICDTPTYVLTKAVQGECHLNGLDSWLGGLIEQRRAEIRSTSQRSARVEMGKLEKKYKGRMPGAKDIGLMLIAREDRIPLITDDASLYQVASDQGVRVLDLFDVALTGMAAGYLLRGQVEELFRYLENPSPHFHPFGWKKLSQQGHPWPQGFDALRAQRRSDAQLRDALGI